MTADLALSWVACLTGIGVFVSSAELWWLGRAESSARGFPWPLEEPVSPPRRSLPFLVAGRALGGLLLVFGVVEGPLLLVALVVLTILIHRETRCCFESADRLTLQTLIALAIAEVFADESIVGMLSLSFLTATVCVAYPIAGWAKLRFAPWRSGHALLDVLSTESYGVPRVARLVERTRSARFLAVSLIAFELTFPVALASPAIACVMLASGMLFHLSVAVVLGLNRFVWCFLAVYPAVWWCSQQVAAAW